jgi:hypothetical protein
MFDCARTISPGPIFEAVVALGQMVHLVSDGPDFNNPFSLNGAYLARDFDIEKVL